MTNRVQNLCEPRIFCLKHSGNCEGLEHSTQPKSKKSFEMKNNAATLFLRQLSAAFLLLSWTTANADVTLPKVIGSNMVLQRDLSVPIWGWAEEGEKVTVSFAGQTKMTETGKNGKWMVKLDKPKASPKPGGCNPRPAGPGSYHRSKFLSFWERMGGG